MNEKTLLDTYPLLNLRHFTVKLKGSKVFSKIDLTKAYHQIPLDEASQKKATVLTPWGAWQFKRLAMGLKNTGQSFQRLMDHIFGDMPNLFVYMDDLIIFSDREQENAENIHLLIVEFVLFCSVRMGLKFARNKTVIMSNEFKFLGHTFKNSANSIPESKKNNFKKMRAPRSRAETISRLASISYFENTLPQLRKVAAPLFNMVKSEQFQWTDVENNDFGTFVI